MTPEFPDFLTCPITRSPLHCEGQFLVSQRWGIKYPIRDGLPVLLASAAILPPAFGSVEQVREAMEDQPPDRPQVP
jgi:uncharacterized protein YbaR (Trm112 family)